MVGEMAVALLQAIGNTANRSELQLHTAVLATVVGLVVALVLVSVDVAVAASESTPAVVAEAGFDRVLGSSCCKTSSREYHT